MSRSRVLFVAQMLRHADFLMWLDVSRLPRLVRDLLYLLKSSRPVLFTFLPLHFFFSEDIILDLTLKFGFQRESMRNIVSSLGILSQEFITLMFVHRLISRIFHIV